MTNPIPGTEFKSIDEALLAFQAEMPTLVKNRQGQVGNQKTKYADLEQANEVVVARLNTLGVIYTCTPTLDDDGKFVLAYELKHVPSDTKKAGRWPLKLSENPQQMGSSTSYGRRYVLLALTGVAAEDEDDDGAMGSGRQAAVQRRQRPANRQQEPAAEGQPVQRKPQTMTGPPLPGEDEPHRGRGGLITMPMTSKLAITMNEVIGTNPADHKQFIADMIGREVATRKDLTFDEGRALIDAFEKAKDTDSPREQVVDIYRRAQGYPSGEDLREAIGLPEPATVRHSQEAPK